MTMYPPLDNTRACEDDSFLASYHGDLLSENPESSLELLNLGRLRFWSGKLMAISLPVYAEWRG
jgi:hypothetical protein